MVEHPHRKRSDPVRLRTWAPFRPNRIDPTRKWETIGSNPKITVYSLWTKQVSRFARSKRPYTQTENVGSNPTGATRQQCPTLRRSLIGKGTRLWSETMASSLGHPARAARKSSPQLVPGRFRCDSERELRPLSTRKCPTRKAPPRGTRLSYEQQRLLHSESDLHAPVF